MICPSCGHDNVPGNDACGHCQQSLTPLDRPIATDRVERSLVEDRVAVLPPKPVITLTAMTPIRDAIRHMLENDVGAVLVVDDQGKLQGIFSERDLLKRLAGVEKDYMALPIGRFMTPRPVTVGAGDTLNFVLHKMDGGGYRHVPVVDGGKPVSVISVRDMLRHMMKLCKDAT
jgi:CBS domain-containing protein